MSRKNYFLGIWLAFCISLLGPLNKKDYKEIVGSQFWRPEVGEGDIGRVTSF